MRENVASAAERVRRRGLARRVCRTTSARLARARRPGARRALCSPARPARRRERAGARHSLAGGDQASREAPSRAARETILARHSAGVAGPVAEEAYAKRRTSEVSSLRLEETGTAAATIGRDVTQKSRIAGLL